MLHAVALYEYARFWGAPRPAEMLCESFLCNVRVVGSLIPCSRTQDWSVHVVLIQHTSQPEQSGAVSNTSKMMFLWLLQVVVMSSLAYHHFIRGGNSELHRQTRLGNIPSQAMNPETMHTHGRQEENF